MASSSPAPLERGKACLRCRRRKMRCDGVRPICGQCVRAEETECEYTDAGPTPSQVLERNVADLEARIRALESRTSDTVTLTDPHAAYRGATGQASAGRPTLRYSENPVEQRLLSTFFDHATTFGFFLNMPRFLRRLTGRFSTSTISPALVNSMQLLTLQLVDDPQLRSHEPQLLSRVLQALAAATANINPATMIEILQAEVLVSFYFFNRDRKLEGGYHATAAVSLAVACDLHKVRGVQGGGSTSPSSGAHYRLPVPADDVEEGERIQGFWVVYCVDRCWTVALKSQSVLSRGDFASQIETPWPIETSNYEQGQYPQALRHRNLPTVKHFLENAASNGWDRSCLALRAQVSTLFERATDLANQWNPAGAPGFQTRFLALDNRIEHFKRSLPGLSLTEASSSQDDRPAQTDTEKLRCMLCCHTLVQCATIQLHTPLQQGQDPTNSRTLAAAIAAANLLREVDVRSLSFVDPIMGVLWSTISQVLIQGIVNLRRMRPRQSSSGRSATPGAHLPGEMVVTSALDCVQMTLEALSGTSPLLERELANLRQARFEMHPNV